MSTVVDLKSRQPEKIFGMENFGNTCYANSVLQCLYYTPPFREQMLSLAPVNRQPRLRMEGSPAHPYTLDPTQNGDALRGRSGSVAQGAAVPNGSGAASSAGSASSPTSNGNQKSSSLGIRIPRLGKNREQESPLAASASTSTSTTLADPVPATRTVSGAGRSFTGSLGSSFGLNQTAAAKQTSRQNGHPGLDGLEVGTRAEGQNLPIVGYTEDINAAPETRKRAALMKGPIINLNQSLSSEYGMKESMLTAVKDLFECVDENESRVGVVSPMNLLEVTKRENDLFRSSMHQDAHEFYNFLLNSIIERVDSTDGLSKPETQWVHDMFEGLITNETRCMTCETVSRRDEKFLDFSVDIEPNSSISHCLRQFSASEMLVGNNKFHCNFCGGLQEAQKRMKIKRAPQILTLHLKRFKFSEEQQSNVKLVHRVAYPKYLRLPVTTEDSEDANKLYELRSVIVHLGGGPYQGHYVAVVKTEVGWLLFDDEVVESVDPNYVFKFFGDPTRLATAYVLFYQQVDEEVAARENLYTNAEVVGEHASFSASSELGSFNDEDEVPSPLAPLRRPSVPFSGGSEFAVGTPDSGYSISPPPNGNLPRAHSPGSTSDDPRRRRSTRESSASKGRESKLFGLFRKNSVTN